MNNQKKKILLVITKSNFGGAQKYVFELAKSLKSQDYEVLVVLGGKGILIDKLEEAQIKVISIPYLGRDVSFIDDAKVFFELYKIIKKEKPDVVHLNSSKIGGIGTLVSRIASVPKIIFTIHGWAFNENRGYVSKLVIKLSYLATLIFCTHAIAVSNTTKKQADFIPFSFLIKNKIKVIYNGIEMPNFLSKEDSINFLSTHLQTNLKDKKIIGQIAELHPIKSQETTIDVALRITQKHQDVIFILIGDGQEKQKLQKQVSDLELDNKVFFTGLIDNASQHIKAFDILCLTSKSEAMPLTILEAGLACVPIISSRVGGISEIIKDNETGFLFESQDTNKFESVIEHVLSLTSVEKDKITNTLFASLKKNFLIEHMTDKTIEMYKK